MNKKMFLNGLLVAMASFGVINVAFAESTPGDELRIVCPSAKNDNPQIRFVASVIPGAIPKIPAVPTEGNKVVGMEEEGTGVDVEWHHDSGLDFHDPENTYKLDRIEQSRTNRIAVNCIYRNKVKKELKSAVSLDDYEGRILNHNASKLCIGASSKNCFLKLLLKSENE